jgi:hypothetical protein
MCKQSRKDEVLTKREGSTLYEERSKGCSSEVNQEGSCTREVQGVEDLAQMNMILISNLMKQAEIAKRETDMIRGLLREREIASLNSQGQFDSIVASLSAEKKSLIINNEALKYRYQTI